jgi:glucokinase-like ROK family protein
MISKQQRLFAEKNTLAVLNVLRQKHRISRASIARITGLTPATVSRIVNRLEDASIIRTVGSGESTGGRRPLLIEFLPDAFYLAGVDIGVTKAIVLVIDLHGKVVSKERIALDAGKEKEEELNQILLAVHRAFDKLGDNKKKIYGIGISFPGVVDTENGIAIQAPNLPKWKNTKLVEIFRREFGLYSALENDAKAMALGEARFGAGRGSKNIFAVYLGRGIGGGFIIDGELYRGTLSISGEIGHITVNPSGPMCSCGNRGCLEVMASGPAIASAAVHAIASGTQSILSEVAKGNLGNITAEAVSAAALKGDELALRLMNEAAEYIGIGLAAIVNLFAPECIVLSGGLASAGDFFLEAMRKTVAERSFTYDRVRPRFARSELGEDSACIGAAALMLEKLLETKFTP